MEIRNYRLWLTVFLINNKENLCWQTGCFCLDLHFCGPQATEKIVWLPCGQWKCLWVIEGQVGIGLTSGIDQCYSLIGNSFSFQKYYSETHQSGTYLMRLLFYRVGHGSMLEGKWIHLFHTQLNIKKNSSNGDWFPWKLLDFFLLLD